ncbi:MAG: MlaD family protein [Chthoniobacteraceae bacterium]|nr:MlaD family protein [Chthoniobacteraceae bacterium]
MANEQKGLEIKVGLFVFIGLAIIAAMAVQFGRVGQGLSDTYDLTVLFPNASGLVKGADVQLSGARIGIVADAPKAIPGQIGVIPVKLKIRSDILLPAKSYFMIGKSGLLGDTSVSIGLPTGFDPKKFDPKNQESIIKPGSEVDGTQGVDFNDLASKGDKNMEKLAENLDELKATLEKVRTGILSDENMANLKDSFASLKTTTDNIAKASTKIDSVVTGAQSTVDTAKETFVEAKQAIVTINNAANDIHGVIADARGAVTTGQNLMKAAQNGQGTLPMLLGNREVADNLRAILSNIRRHGVLFYRDSTPAPAPAPVAVPLKARH